MTTWYRSATPGESEVLAMAAAGVENDGELLMFRDAVLARAEANKNKDRFSPQGIEELAATISLMPIDDEHIERRVIGIFTAGRAIKDALVTDGFIFAKRFPDEAAAVLEGRKQLSVEAEVATATCSVCGQQFTRRSQYCEHLKSPLTSGAERILSGLKAVGGGITATPAGTDTKFDRNQMVFLASENEDAPLRVVASATQDEVKEDMPENSMQELQELRARVQELVASLAEATTQRDGLQQTLAEATTERDRLQAALTETELSHARHVRLLAAGFAAQEIEPIKSKLGVTDDAVIDLLIASHQNVLVESDTASVEDVPGEEDEPEDKVEARQDTVLGDDEPGKATILQWSPELFG